MPEGTLPVAPRASLVISTYNWPEALAAVLNSVRQQAVPPSEVVIADDGSSGATRELIARMAATFPVPLHHVWHEDLGFRAGTIRNKAVAAATGAYIIQLDGDLVLHPAFVAGHVRFARRGTYVQGSRVLLNATATQRVLAGGAPPGHVLSGGIRNRVNAINAVWLSHLVRGERDPYRRIRGCNFAFWRDDFVRVNGYDETIEGWGREDNELAVRLHNAGVRRRNLKFGAVAWHLHHEYRSRQDVARNQAILDRTRTEGLIRCQRGIDQWLSTRPVGSSARQDGAPR